MSSFLDTTHDAGRIAPRVARVWAAYACAMPADGAWSAVPTLGTSNDHKPGRPRRPRVTSP